MKNHQKIKCPVCKKNRWVLNGNVNKIKRAEITARCLKCSRMKKGESNGGGFTRGFTPWNKDTKGLMPIPWNKDLKGVGTNNKNGMWKGDDASYYAKHIWLKTNFGKADECQNMDCKGRSKTYHWALKKGFKYEHKRENYLKLCVSCHQLYDRGKLILNKEKYAI